MIKTPRYGAEITQEWLEAILGQHESKSKPGTTVAISSFNVARGAQPGDNFGSAVVKAEVTGQVINNSQDTQTEAKYNLFFKFLPGNTFEQQVIRPIMAHMRELLVYSSIISDLNEFQEKRTGDKYRIQVPGLVYGMCTPDDYVLLMDDIRAQGYSTLDKRGSLDLPHVTMAVSALARLHAVSYAFDKTHNFLEKYPLFAGDDLRPTFFKLFVSVFYDMITNFLRQEKKQKYINLVEDMEKNKEKFLNRIADLHGNNYGGGINCLVHCDYWTNNLMFSHREEDGEATVVPRDIMMIDWAFAYWEHPIYDLQYFLHTSTSRALRKEHLDQVLRQYYAELTTAAADLGAPITNWTFEDLQRDWRKTKPCGIVMGIMVKVFSLSKAGEKMGSSKGFPTTGLSDVIQKLLGRLMSRTLFNPSIPGMLSLIKKANSANFRPMVNELLQGENDLLVSRCHDILEDALEEAAFDMAE